MEGKYKVVISFADEQSELAETIAAFCKTHGLSCYYYKEDVGRTTGRVLEDESLKIYQYEACLNVVIWSENYCKTKYTTMEWELVSQRRKSYPESLLVVWRDENVSNPPPVELGYTRWKGNQYKLFDEILVRVRGCTPYKKKRKKKSVEVSTGVIEHLGINM